MKRRVFFGLGSNIGDRAAELRRAVESLPSVQSVSPVYETDPVGGPEQDDFFNCVVVCFTERNAQELLAIAQNAEAKAERTRTVKNGPRTLDVDILIIEGEAVDESDLQIPHPRMGERRFVLQPLSDVAPELISASDLEKATGKVRWLGPLEDLG